MYIKLLELCLTCAKSALPIMILIISTFTVSELHWPLLPISAIYSQHFLGYYV